MGGLVLAVVCCAVLWRSVVWRLCAAVMCVAAVLVCRWKPFVVFLLVAHLFVCVSVPLHFASVQKMRGKGGSDSSEKE